MIYVENKIEREGTEEGEGERRKGGSERGVFK
jgi:hypothetical protein